LRYGSEWFQEEVGEVFVVFSRKCGMSVRDSAGKGAGM